MMYKSLTSLLSELIDPVPAETRELLCKARTGLPQEFDTDNQFIGRQYAGCGATIGVMPRCDFACRGCYLNRSANRTRPESMARIKQQLRAIREWLGEGGNAQITDGEATLRPVNELIEIIRYAIEIGLVPMLMTHGDGFRKDPGLLARLMVEGGLSELSIHIDTTQRGRMGRSYKHADSEADLMPLRDEFATLIRKVRRTTGKPLAVATTVTVTEDNIGAIPEIIRWVCNNADAFKMISFQPLAQVGRTDSTLAGVRSVEQLWSGIALSLDEEGCAEEKTLNHTGTFGHPACTRFVQGLVVNQEAKPAVFHPLFRIDDANSMDLLNQLGKRFGGVSFRRGSGWQKLTRALRLIAQDPKFLALRVIPYAWRTLAALAPDGRLHLLSMYLQGKIRVNYLNIVSHHFMSRQEIQTPLGQERLNACVFKVPVNGDLVSMCEVNALGIREKYYASIDAIHSSTAPITPKQVPLRSTADTKLAISDPQTA